MDASDPTGIKDRSEQQDFDWKNCWYPVSFLQDLPRDVPTGFTLYDMPLVLFFDGNGTLSCLRDLCPHRAARLSDGQITDGHLECLYHGWQFAADGSCVHIPQKLPGKAMPKKACVRQFPLEVRQGIVWIWNGEPDLADPSRIPVRPEASGEGIYDVTFQMDLPYDQSYLIENVIDVAHIHIAHDGVRGGGVREAAKPLEFEILESSITGIRSTFHSVGLKRDPDSPGLQGALVEYVAPNLIRYTSQYRDDDLVAGLELFSIPLGKGRCRLLYRKFSNFTSWREKIKPRWLEHQTQILILEQDMGVVMGQHEEIETADGDLRDLWLPLKSSDRLVIEYRKWLDFFGRTLPFYRGLTSAKNSAIADGYTHFDRDRHTLHTKVCSTCSRLHRNIGRSISALWVVSAVGFALGALNGANGLGVSAVVFALLSLLGIAGLKRFRTKF